MEVSIIGGGIQGLSTGVLLEMLGHDTTIFSKDYPYIDGDHVPTVASNYASASVYPVAVETEYEEDALIQRCEESFRPFCETDGAPVRTQTHFYVYEYEVDERLPARMEVQDIAEYTKPIPSRDGGQIVDGYVCKEYMVEMPEYMPRLYELYREMGGTAAHRVIEPDEVGALPGEYTFNCSGYGSRALFGDDSMRAMKGHILELPYDGDEPLEFSYVYNPSDYDGYAYMYPRKQTVVFDGSYLEGDIVDGEWTGESPTNPVTVDGEAVPERLVAVSSEIMNDYVEFDREAISVKYGYRPYREDGLRVEAEEGLVHNYGHGGAGVSLSWVSAIEAIQHIDSVPETQLERIAARMSDLG